MSYTDSFTNADGTAIHVHNANWATNANMTISGDAITYATGTPSRSRYSGQTFSDDHYSQAVLFGVSSTLAHAVSCRDNGSRWVYLASRNNLMIIYDNGGNVGQYSGAVSNGDVIRLEVEGTVARAYQNGTLRITASLTIATSGGQPGIGYANINTGGLFDDWEGGDLVGDTRAVPLISQSVKASSSIAAVAAMQSRRFG